jgi:type II secretory pathway component PulF
MKALTHQDMAQFSRNMVKFMAGGLSLLNALDAAAASADNVSAAIVIRQLKQQLEHGDALSDAIRSKSRYLDEVCAAIMQASESGPETLIGGFEALAIYQEKIQPHLHIEIDEDRDTTVPTILETALFLRMLRAMLSVRYGLHSALNVLATTNMNEPIRLLSARVLSQINAGSSLLDAMKAYPDLFDESALRLISLGEESLDLMLVALDRAAEYKESLSNGLPEEIMIDDVAVFMTRVATLMELELTLNQALAEAAEDYTYNPVLRELIVDLNNKVESGMMFAEACETHPEYFDDQSVRAMEAGEEAGSPENFITLMRHIADRFKRRAEEEAPDAPIFKTSVFISHSSQNREQIEEQLVGPLETAGVTCWYARHAIKSASEWERSILQGLEHCEWYLIVMSREAMESEWVKDELFWAIDNRANRIVPVLLDDSDPAEFHIRMRRLQVVTMGEDPDVTVAAILRTLRREV